MALEDLEAEKARKKQERQERRKRKRWGAKQPETTTNATATATSTAAAMDPKARILAMQESVKARLAAAKAAAAATQGAGGINKGQAADNIPQQPPVKRAKVFELDMSITGPTFKEGTTTQTSKTENKSSIVAEKPKRPSNPYLAHRQEYDETTAEDYNDDEEFIDERLSRTSKPRKRHKEFNFIEPGKWQEIANVKREKEQKAVESGYTSGRKTGHTIHAATLTEIYGGGGGGGGGANDTIDENIDNNISNAIETPRADTHPDTKMPIAMEWWDMELLPTALKKEVAAEESKLLAKQTKAALKNLDNDTTATTTTTTLNNDNVDNDSNKKNGEDKSEEKDNNNETDLNDLRERCFQQASLSYSKTAALVQHIVPIKPPNASTEPPKQPVLRLTKKELKRQRKLRRQEKQRQLQDLQAAGLIPAPEPRLTLRNFIQVLGDQAFVDPSQMEQKVQEQVQARQRAHIQRNEQNKLTKEQLAGKRTRKLQEDTSQGVTVAIFYVKDMSHPYHRAKVDLNAQQLNLTGCVLECNEQQPTFAIVIVEGGPKAIKRYTRLMLVRMKWTGPDGADDDDDDDDNPEENDETATTIHKFNPDNKCEAVWQGKVIKRIFNGFIFQSCETYNQGRKILKSKGIEHYWDQTIQHATGQCNNKFTFKLTNNSDDDDDEDNHNVDKNNNNAEIDDDKMET